MSEEFWKLCSEVVVALAEPMFASHVFEVFPDVEDWFQLSYDGTQLSRPLNRGLILRTIIKHGYDNRKADVYPGGWQHGVLRAFQDWKLLA